MQIDSVSHGGGEEEPHSQLFIVMDNCVLPFSSNATFSFNLIFDKPYDMKTQVLSAFFSLALIAPAFAAPVDFVNPFVGTDATGHTFPAASYPFGLVQAGPDTGCSGWDYCSGYRYSDSRIVAFSQTHLNGTGCGDLGDLKVMPFRGENPAPSTFSHEEESASPGYYSVRLREAAARVEIAVSAHAAIYRITGEGRLGLAVDPSYGIGGTAEPRGVAVADDRTGLSGMVHRKGWVERTFAFTVVFDRPATEVRGNSTCFTFELSADRPLLVKLALSAEGGVGAARRNLAAEIPGWDFDAVHAAAVAKWNDYLGRVKADGSVDQKQNLYTSLYHLFLQPNNIADVGERPFYSTFSCWDTFRAAAPLYTVLVPELVPGMVGSLLEQGRRTGFLPIWTLWGQDNQCMIATHSVPMIVDAYLKGLLPADAAEGAYRQIKDTLTQPHEGRLKENWDILNRYGYYPFDRIKGESVARTMECAYDDWCAGVMARRLGHGEDADFFFRRSGNWRNVFDPELKFVRGKDSKGVWRTPYNPYALGHGASTANDFTEGNAFQFTWHVMQDPGGLIAAMGGRAEFLGKLDSLFTENSQAEGMGHVVDVTGLIGQYVHGNEPSHHVIYFYTLAGRPDKAAERIREVFDKFYLPKPDGLCGNDDCGQMSAWYVFGALGFYPFNPCGGEYVLGAPQVPRVSLRLANGRTLSIVAKDLSAKNKYVKSAAYRAPGSPAARPLKTAILHEDLMRGGEIVFEMTDRPDGAFAGGGAR